ncbi:hypothetical protein HB825_01585 [Listeria booriae]|uniref:Uncharacterized protein n=1 Tax=Listeria booriae TaxID=1552123 RepID=A0A7X0XEP8_9LIST|nr:hypothetical protein [Listeria booriae]MBC1492657.1 hypothetical protein [Listeria booriae]MBC1502443.1 hypothetical protein [Listeria booriae]MBC1511353.1 hypothetical protein [Listeria booriae]MBC1523472.1 hypothetical protein [Listeria booriae]MBC1529749.1 hypothetical protein [Listeria booriae]
MDKITQMNEEIFAENLLKATNELKEKMGIQSTVNRFIIEPVDEEGKMLDGGDEMMKRLVLTKDNIGDKKLSVEDVVGVLGGLFPKAPLWINISFINIEEEVAVFRLDTSLRFRKPTLLRNSESGHAPFKVIC